MTFVRCCLVAVLAVLVAGGGAAGAASLITSKDIKNGSIGTADLSSKAKRQLKGARGPAGPRGLQGPAGPQGPVGSGGGGVGGALNVVTVSAGKTVLAGAVDGPVVTCPAGRVVVGTGFFNSVTDVGFVQPLGDGRSVGLGVLNNTAIDVEVDVLAMCAPGSASGVSSAAAKRGFAARLAELK